MLEKLNNVLLQSILLEDNAIIKTKEGLDEFLNSFDNQKLSNFITPYIIKEKDNNFIISLEEMTNSKKQLIEYITKNFQDILKLYVTILETEEVEFIKEIAEKGTVTFTISNPKASLKFVMFMKEFAFSKVHFNEKDEKITIYIPKEYANALKNALKDKKNLENNKKFNEIIDAIIGMLEAYAVIPFKDMYKMLSEFFDISKEEILDALKIKALTDDIINLNVYKGKLYICSIEFFLEKDAYFFYKKQKGKYKKFSYEELIALKNNEYLEMLPSYKKLFTHLDENYNLKEETPFEICKLFLIYDYLVNAQSDEKLAKKQFFSSIDEFFEMEEHEKKETYRLMRLVYNDYPKWIKRGNN